MIAYKDAKCLRLKKGSFSPLTFSTSSLYQLTRLGKRGNTHKNYIQQELVLLEDLAIRRQIIYFEILSYLPRNMVNPELHLFRYDPRNLGKATGEWNERDLSESVDVW